MQATIREVVEQERGAGRDDHQTATLLRPSKVPLPEGNWHHWTAACIREGVMGEGAGEHQAATR